MTRRTHARSRPRPAWRRGGGETLEAPPRITFGETRTRESDGPRRVRPRPSVHRRLRRRVPQRSPSPRPDPHRADAPRPPGRAEHGDLRLGVSGFAAGRVRRNDAQRGCAGTRPSDRVSAGDQRGVRRHCDHGLAARGDAPRLPLRRRRWYLVREVPGGRPRRRRTASRRVHRHGPRRRRRRVRRRRPLGEELDASIVVCRAAERSAHADALSRRSGRGARARSSCDRAVTRQRIVDGNEDRGRCRRRHRVGRARPGTNTSGDPGDRRARAASTTRRPAADSAEPRPRTRDLRGPLPARDGLRRRESTQPHHRRPARRMDRHRRVRHHLSGAAGGVPTARTPRRAVDRGAGDPTAQAPAPTAVRSRHRPRVRARPRGAARHRGEAAQHRAPREGRVVRLGRATPGAGKGRRARQRPHRRLRRTRRRRAGPGVTGATHACGRPTRPRATSPHCAHGHVGDSIAVLLLRLPAQSFDHCGA